MDGLRRAFTSTFFNGLATPTSSADKLDHSGIPVSEDPCRTCANPCDVGHLEYPQRFNVDLTSDMLGSVKPYQRQVVISTGKADWAREVTSDKDSLAQLLHCTARKHRRPSLSLHDSATQTDTTLADVPGVYSTNKVANGLSVLNGSHRSLSDEEGSESVLVFPDFKLVKDVKCSLEGAHSMWENTLDPEVPRAGRSKVDSNTKSWVLPYACVILLCSHKRRDNRCHIAAPKLELALTQSLESHGYNVHTQLDEPHGPALEDFQGSSDEREEYCIDQIDALGSTNGSREILIIKTSHIGGHKYSGNVVIYTPQGAGIWYGRVTPHEIPAVVESTIIHGKVLPALLRGGVNLAAPHRTSLFEW